MKAQTSKRKAIAPSLLSPSRINTFKKCGEAYRLQYEAKVKSEEFDYLSDGRAAHEVLEAYARAVRKDEPFSVEAMGAKLGLDDYVIRSIKSVEWPKTFLEDDQVIIEGKMAVDTDFVSTSWDKAWLRGIVDLGWMEHGANGPMYVIRDWKTGYKVPSQEEMEKELQGAIYALFLFCHIDIEMEVLVQYYYIRSGAVRSVLYDINEVVNRVYDEITEVEKAMQSGERQARIGAHCATCSVRRACEHYGNSFHEDHILNIDSPASAIMAAEKYLTLKAMTSDLEGELKEYAKTGAIKTSKGDLGYFPSEKITYNYEAARPILIDNGIDEEKMIEKVDLSKSAMKSIVGSGKKNRGIWDKLGLLEKREISTRFTTKKQDE